MIKCIKIHKFKQIYISTQKFNRAPPGGSFFYSHAYFAAAKRGRFSVFEKHHKSAVIVYVEHARICCFFALNKENILARNVGILAVFWDKFSFGKLFCKREQLVCNACGNMVSVCIFKCEG